MKLDASIPEVLVLVRMKGLEPPRREALDPKSNAATNYATPAWKIRANLKVFLRKSQKVFVFFVKNYRYPM